MSLNSKSLSSEQLKMFISKIGVNIPQEIIVSYQDIEREEDDFIRTVFTTLEGNVPAFVIQIAENFAESIALSYSLLSDNDIDVLGKEIEQIDKENYRYYDNTLSYLLMDGVNLYNVKEDTFKISLLDNVYKNIASKEEMIKVILTTWAHCGGWGGIIVRGLKVGYKGGGFHGENHEIDFNGTSYAYNSNLLEDNEKPYFE